MTTALLGLTRRSWFSEKSPSNVSEEASVLELNHVHLRVQQCGDAEGLPRAGLEQSSERHHHSRSDSEDSEAVVMQQVGWVLTWTCSCCLGLSPCSGRAMLKRSFPLSSRESALCSGRNCSGRIPIPTSCFLCSFSKLSATTARTPWSSR